MNRPDIEVGLVSTIIPVYNRPLLLRDAVESVLGQTYPSIEILIVDDGSTDDTPAVINKLVAENSDIIRSVRIPNSGPGGAREAGRQLARGEFIQYLDSDDLLLPRKFEWQVNGLNMNPDCGVSYGVTRHYEIGTIPNDTPWKWTGRKIDRMFPSFLESRWWATATPLFRRSVVDLAGPWLTLKNEEDWEYDCRVASQGIKLHQCEAAVVDVRIHSGLRLSQNARSVIDKFKDRARAHEAILGHAWKAGVPVDSNEMRHFSRELFLLCRQCGDVGLPDEAATLFRLSKETDRNRGNGLQFRLYELGAGIVGWSQMGRLSAVLDGMRKGL